MELLGLVFTLEKCEVDIKSEQNLRNCSHICP